MRYRSGWSALQVPDEDGNCDWHSHMLDKDWRESEGSLFGEWGIEGENANHMRAFLDLMADGRVLELYDYVDLLNWTHDKQKEFCRKVFSIYGKAFGFFLSRDCSEAWYEVLCENGLGYPRPAKELWEKYKRGEVSLGDSKQGNSLKFDKSIFGEFESSKW